MEFGLLIDYPGAIPTIASWYFQEWGHRRPGRHSVASVAEDLKAYLNRDKVPLIVLGVDEQLVVGVAQLKFREMDIYPDRVHWLGGVFVDSNCRRMGLGSRLVDRVVEIARMLEIRKLSLQTERLDGGVYARLGWEPVERARSYLGEVLVMEKRL